MEQKETRWSWCVYFIVSLSTETCIDQDLEHFEIILWSKVRWNTWQKQTKFLADAGRLLNDKAPTTGAVLTGTLKWTPCMKTEQSKVYEHHVNYRLPYQHRNHYWSHATPQHDCMYLESTALSPLSVRDTLCPDLILAMSTSSTTLESAGTLPFQGPCNIWKCVPVNNKPSAIANRLDWAMVQFWLLQSVTTPPLTWRDREKSQKFVVKVAYLLAKIWKSELPKQDCWRHSVTCTCCIVSDIQSYAHAALLATFSHMHVLHC